MQNFDNKNIQPLKILYHHRTLGDGAEGIHISEMIAAFRQRGHKVRVISPIGTKTSFQNSRTRFLTRLKVVVPYFIFELMEIAYSLIGAFKLIKAARKWKPDFIYVRYITFNLSSVIARKFLNIPVLLEVNAPLALERAEQPDEKLFFKRLASWMEFTICRQSTHTIVVSTPLQQYLINNSIADKTITVMPNGVNLERFTLPTEKEIAIKKNLLNIPDDATVIGFVGIMRHWHGVEGLIEVFCKLLIDEPKLYLLLVGDGPEIKNYTQLLNRKGVSSRAHITGRINHNDIPKYISVFDIAMAPKSTFYASPLKIVEYMALAKPVIAPKTQNIEDLIDSHYDGILFDPKDPNGMYSALKRLLQDDEFRKSISQAAREKCENKLNWNNNAFHCQELMKPYV